MEKEKIQKLLYKYSKGQCTDTEKAWVEALYEKLSQKTPANLENELIREDVQEIYQRLFSSSGTKHLGSWISAAAILLVFISAGFYFYIRKGQTPIANILVQHAQSGPHAFAPGSNKALLTLSDGSTIALNEANNGKIWDGDGITITKEADGIIRYQISAATGSIGSHQLSTPKGGQYQVILSDGTKIWLNAASSLSYPVSSQEKTRRVTLTGEAYFDIAQNKRLPFKVFTEQQELEVLGTQFNVNSYEDEPDTRTTLLTGKIKISSARTHRSTFLKPGEQAVLKKNGNIKISKVHAENAIAWKSGLFQFHDSDIQQAMRQLARWYNMDIEFEGPVPDIRLWGEVHRDANAMEALEILSYFDLKYQVDTTGNTPKIIIIQ